MNRGRCATTLLILLVLTTCGSALTGCGGALATPIQIADPETPYMLLEDMTALVGVEDVDRPGQIVEFGRVRLPRGMTLLWYDWNRATEDP